VHSREGIYHVPLWIDLTLAQAYTTYVRSMPMAVSRRISAVARRRTSG
jgi:hypothetical protein